MSFFKNIITGGNYNKLLKEEESFNELNERFYLFQNDFLLINKERHKALVYLMHEREDALKNLTLAKNLISKFTEIKGKENAKVIDAVSNVDKIENHIYLGDLTINFQSGLDSVSETFLNSLEGSLIRLDEKKGYSKNELKAEFTMIAFDVVAEGVGQIIQLNSEVNAKRRKIIEAREQINSSIKKMTVKAPKIYQELKRIIEISKVLNKHNQVFSQKYKTIIDEMNSDSKWSNFINEVLNRKIVANDKMIEDLKYLLAYSSEYNKLNKGAKV
ncbi:hypothetical protein GN157_14810 [Flavobacterium rakeshii]|uniref:Uncharacterized protein n=1 Tax=Flavobacterium rakeshii TaxID=1038845 RepID=A0A6N8HGW4_9FLAO|nr:hypothetical protein [Flavobacterium rakeshii]MUV04985.1 hypothetical protein [Flavobacterium rakeshii]